MGHIRNTIHDQRTNEEIDVSVGGLRGCAGRTDVDTLREFRGVAPVDSVRRVKAATAVNGNSATTEILYLGNGVTLAIDPLREVIAL
jgi:hypothetical protein